MKVVVTGGCGFIGSNYVRGLLESRWGTVPTQVTVIDVLTYAGNIANLDPVIGDTRLTLHTVDINQNLTLIAALLTVVALFAPMF